ncbi:ribonuclease HI family protein [Candidatus Omnitrophota bacterium]
MASEKTSIYIDGAARGNPGPAGIGIIIKDAKGQDIRCLYKYIGETSNNLAEYTALIYALQEALILGLKDLAVYSDSELLTKQLNGEYKVKNLGLKPYYEQFLHLKTGLENFKIKQIAREQNKAADSLANQAIDSRIDTGLKSA